jgi:universal stress protein E
MKRYMNVLWAVWGSEDPLPAARTAVELAKRNHARLTALEVLPSLPRSLSGLERKDPPLQVSDLIRAHREESLRALLEPLAPGMDVDCKVRFGTPFVEITREVIRSGNDLVVAVPDKSRGMRGALLGGNAMHLLRKCPSAVWLVKPDDADSSRSLLAAVDPNPDLHDEIREGLNDSIVEIASSLARIAGAKLHVVHGWSAYAESILRGRGGLPEEQVRAYVDETLAARRVALDALIARHALSDITVETHLLKGDAAQVVPDLAVSVRAALIVIGTVCRTGVAGLLIGNTAETIIQQVDCSILTIKPRGFQTPITV